ncbi:MAG: sialate O-acetylesterase, partial [Pirellulales bacterium]
GTSEQGWKTIQSASGFSALSLAFANELYQELDVPVGILLTSHSNTRIEAFTERNAIEAHPELKSDAEQIHTGDATTASGQAAFAQFYRDLAAWQDEAAELGFPLERSPKRPELPGIAGSWRGPTQFFNGKIAPVIPYAIRGSIWCQGTSNSGDSRLYAARMEALVNGWRAAWGMPEMPFYFTQMQCYGNPDPNNVGFADIRQAQHLFFMNNRPHVGMVVQTDLNPASSGNIHYQNKLHPGMRLARWALAHEYGRDIAYTGPIYNGYKVEGDKVVVSFEAESLFGGLMVGSKGQEQDHRTGEYVEPAQPTPGQNLTHFRLCGADKQWHTANAVIEGETVVVRSPKVPEPTGVQYAYSASPITSNLYNKAGLPATPFAAIDGKLIFEYETEEEQIAALEAKYARYIDPDYPIFQVVEYFRDGAVIQRDQPIQVWGHANQGVEVKVTLGDATKSAVADERQQWSVTFPARKASTEPITLSAQSSHGHSRTINDILVGDVWFLTGSTLLRSESAYNQRDPAAEKPGAMPLVREFKMNTKASWSATPRKRQFETGGGKYRSHWLAADWSREGQGVTMFAYHFAKALNRPDVPQGFITMSSGQGGSMASPLSWTSYAGVAEVTHPPFQKRLEALRLQDPASVIARKTTAKYVDALKACQRSIVEVSERGADMSAAPRAFPAFPNASEVIDVKPDTIPTYAHNWCVSPFTPMGVAGVVWVPDASNIGHTPADYAAELEVYARSLPGTYGQDQVPFLYAQPAGSLIEGVTAPSIPGAKQVTIEEWPKSLRELAAQLGQFAK